MHTMNLKATVKITEQRILANKSTRERRMKKNPKQKHLANSKGGRKRGKGEQGTTRTNRKQEQILNLNPATY